MTTWRLIILICELWHYKSIQLHSANHRTPRLFCWTSTCGTGGTAAAGGDTTELGIQVRGAWNPWAFGRDIFP